MSIDKQTSSSSSCRSTKSSRLRDIYAMCKSMNNQLKIVRQQCDRSIAAWKALHHDALPPTPSRTDGEEDGDDNGGDEEGEDAPTMERSNLTFYPSYNRMRPALHVLGAPPMTTLSNQQVR
ncbi:hypothetical protein AAG906_039593 [Vitis piasezkii]